LKGYITKTYDSTKFYVSKINGDPRRKTFEKGNTVTYTMDESKAKVYPKKVFDAIYKEFETVNRGPRPVFKKID